jgi:single-strand DNA-binding protein
MNIVAVIGNVASEPAYQSNYIGGGAAVCTFRIAVNRPGGDFADFFTVETTGRQADVCAEYLNIGRRVAVEGRLKQAHGASVNDQPAALVCISANRVQLLNAAPRTQTVQQ